MELILLRVGKLGAISGASNAASLGTGLMLVQVLN